MVKVARFDRRRTERRLRDRRRRLPSPKTRARLQSIVDKMQVLALVRPSALIAIEAIVDRQLERFGG